MNPYPLEVHDLTVCYQQQPVLYGVDWQLPAGALVAIMGPNGAGKSTLIKTIMGLITPVRGWVQLFGLPASKALGRVGYVPQRESVDWDFPVTVWDVVMMGRYGHLGLFGRPGAHDRDIVAQSLEAVEMTLYAERQIAQLSGGQQQRVFLARALAQQSDLYLMDEPFSGVDAATEGAILKVLKTLRSQGKTIVVVHHDLATAQAYFDFIAFINMRLVAFGPSQAVFTPENLHRTYGGRLSTLSDVAAAQARDLHPQT
jgi:manganese/zinc/iron transport system ATP- binding protein